MKRPRALMLPTGLNWPRVLLDAETTACMQALRATEAVPIRPGWSAIATGASVAGLMRKAMAVLPQASALYLAHTDPVPLADAIAQVAGETQGLPVRGLGDLPETNETHRLVLAPGFAACRADLVDLNQWRAIWAGLTRPDDLAMFTLPAWTDPALLEARWSAANPGAAVTADPRTTRLSVALPGLAAVVVSHLRAVDAEVWLADGGFALVDCLAVDGVLAVLARRRG